MRIGQLPLFSLLALLALTGCSSMPDAEVPELYRKVVDVPKSKADLFEVSLRWMERGFRSADSAIEEKNDGTGLIRARVKARGHFSAIGESEISFDLSIEVKDYKARLGFSNIRGSSSRLGGKSWPYFAAWADDLISDYRKFSISTDSSW
jgi:hypothetical protein